MWTRSACVRTANRINGHVLTRSSSTFDASLTSLVLSIREAVLTESPKRQ